ncbi:MAG: Flp pilus assembly protein TadD [Myxococcota bacterium]
MDTLQELAATLEAAETYLRSLAARELTYPEFVRAELRARRHASALLTDDLRPQTRPADAVGALGGEAAVALAAGAAILSAVVEVDDVVAGGADSVDVLDDDLQLDDLQLDEPEGDDDVELSEVEGVQDAAPVSEVAEAASDLAIPGMSGGDEFDLFGDDDALDLDGVPVISVEADESGDEEELEFDDDISLIATDDEADAPAADGGPLGVADAPAEARSDDGLAEHSGDAEDADAADAALLVDFDDSTPLLDFDDSTPLVDFDDSTPLVDFDDLSDDLESDEPEPLLVTGVEDLAGLVSIDDGNEPEVGYLTYDDSGNLVGGDEDDKPARVKPAAAEDVSQYITWTDGPELDLADDDDDDGADAEETLIIDEEMADTLSDAMVAADDDALDVLDAELFEDEEDPSSSLGLLPDVVEEPDTDTDDDDDEDDGFGDFEDEEVTFIADVGDIDRLRRRTTDVEHIDIAKPAVASVVAGTAAVQVGRTVTAGLYGGPSLPTIREGHEPRPRAAAIQINATAGTGKVIGLEEEDEPIEIGDVGDYGDEEEDEYDYDSEGGFRVELQEYEEEEDDFEPDEPTDTRVGPEPAPAVLPAPAEVAPRAGEVAAMFRKAEQAALVGDMQLGAEVFSDVIDLDPDNHRAFVGRGRLYLDLGDYTRAMSDFMLAEDIAPTDPEPQIAIGDLFFARKDYRKAISYFNAALEVAPNHSMAFCRRGISHYYRKNYPQAMDDLVRARKLDGDIPNIETYITMAKKKARR